MLDPEMFWLNLTNALLGLVVLAYVLGFGYAVCKEIAIRIKRRFSLSAELDRDMHDLLH